MALVVAISLELIVAVQLLVFIVALPAGFLIGWYANVRAERRRPWWRVLVNSAYAGLVTALGLTVLYVGLRLLFVYADTGYRDALQGGPLQCQPGPDCSYQRYLGAGEGPTLVAAGVHDAASFEAWFLTGQLQGGVGLMAITIGGAIVGGIYAGARPARQESESAASVT
jgi:hypothetical protein